MKKSYWLAIVIPFACFCLFIYGLCALSTYNESRMKHKEFTSRLSHVSYDVKMFGDIDSTTLFFYDGNEITVENKLVLDSDEWYHVEYDYLHGYDALYNIKIRKVDAP